MVNFHCLGEESYELKKYEEAIEYYNEAIALNQKNSKYWHWKGIKQIKKRNKIANIIKRNMRIK